MGVTQERNDGRERPVTSDNGGGLRRLMILGCGREPDASRNGLACHDGDGEQLAVALLPPNEGKYINNNTTKMPKRKGGPRCMNASLNQPSNRYFVCCEAQGSVLLSSTRRVQLPMGTRLGCFRPRTLSPLRVVVGRSIKAEEASAEFADVVRSGSQI